MIINFLRFIRKRLMLGKQYISRTTTYLSVINSGMILFLFLSRLKESGYIQVDLDKYFYVVFAVGMISLFIIGWIDVKYLRGMQTENTISFNLHPPLSEMKGKIDEMYEDFKEKKDG